jgi:hypothetical protein
MRIIKFMASILLIAFIMPMTGCGGGSSGENADGGGNAGTSIVPEGAIWSSQAIRRDTPPPTEK